MRDLDLESHQTPESESKNRAPVAPSLRGSTLHPLLAFQAPPTWKLRKDAVVFGAGTS